MIGIIVTSFLRNELLYKNVQSILNNFPKDCMLLVGNQSYKDCKEQDKGIKEFYYSIDNFIDKKIYYFNLPFDCGLSKSRNLLIKEAKKLGCSYVLVSADSIKFTKKYNFLPIIRFLESNQYYGLVGFEIKNRIYWNCDVHCINDKIMLDVPKREPIVYNNVTYQPCDIIKNFFLAKIDFLLEHPYDDELKLAEHFIWFYHYPYKVFFTNHIIAKYIKVHNSEYNKYRQRISYYRNLCCKKYNIKGWHNYTFALKQKFNQWKGR